MNRHLPAASRLKSTIFISAALLTSAIPLLAHDVVFRNDRDAGSLIELYSSEGCSSCPPAEAWMNHLLTEPGLWKDIFPIVFHVDYWDGLGWPDRFARAEYTQRQRDYGALLNQESVYTPEFVVNGLEWRRDFLNGTKLPADAAKKSGQLSITIGNSNTTAIARYLPDTASPPGPLKINLALLGFHLVTDVKRGENEGRTLEHDFVVLDFITSALPRDATGGFGSAPLTLASSTNDPPGAVVAWVSGGGGTILQVAGGWLISPTP